MKVFVVYAHPSADSFTREALDSFLAGLESSGHSYELSDLYAMNFVTDLSEAEYLREAYYRREIPPPPDVLAEQEKINAADAIAFVFPLFWSDAPAKLVGWFSRVWTYGFAYGEGRTMRTLEKALVICSAGNTMEHFRETGILGALEKVMLDDRIHDRAKAKELVIMEGTSRETALREAGRERNLALAFQAGASI
ncbi:MAG: NAD(P)H-dependent oxidoreductase [Treponema sp.]|nr:NAD(P)H-dependent oxidoreductase [Treponema sp.]